MNQVLTVKNHHRGDQNPNCVCVSLQNVPGVVECLKIITRNKSLRIADYAFRTARAQGRRRVTAVHKANIMSVFANALSITVSHRTT